MSKLRKWLDEKLITPAKSLSGSEIGMATAIGFWGGVFPIPAMSTFATLGLCTTIFVSMFNPAMTTIAVSINLAATPIQLMFMPIFMDLPSHFINVPSCSVSDLLVSIKQNPFLETLGTFGWCMVWSILAWVVLAPFSIFGVRLLICSIIGNKRNRD